MSENKKGLNRRKFIGSTGTGAAAFAAMTSAPAFLANANPNDTIGVGHIGVGVRGGQLVQNVAGEPEKGRPGIEGTQIRAISDIYQGHMDKGIRTCANPNAKRYHNYQEMLTDDDIDAVIIATPDHWHSKMVIDAANAGKDIYVEKCWTRTVPEARDMLKAIKVNNTVMQLGHDRSSKAALQASELILQEKILGEITLVETGTFRNRQRGKDEWRWYGFYNVYDRPDEEETRKQVDWPKFLGDAPYHPFSMERFWHWRCYWDYGTGIAGDLLSHSFDFANYILKMGIPHKCIATGQIGLLDDGRECPDIWHAIYEYPEKGMTYTYSGSFNTQSHTLGSHEVRVRGKDAYMNVDQSGFEVYPEEDQKRYSDKPANESMISFDPSKTPDQPDHVEDFFNCMRTRQKPKDNEDEAFVEAITCIMSVESYFKQRAVFWDDERQEIV